MIDSFKGPHSFLSNFFPSAIVYDTIEWPSVEHAYQAYKTLDVESRLHILLKCQTAGQAKRVGQHVELRPNWNSIRVTLMRELIREKFQTGHILADELVLTFPHKLVEGNTWHDTFWGKCTCIHHDGEGQNWLGRLLEERRAELMILYSKVGDFTVSDMPGGPAGCEAPLS